MTPGLPFTYSSYNCSSGKRQLQGDEGSAVQKHIGPGSKDIVPLINVILATQDDPRPALLAQESNLQSEHALSYPG